MQVTFLSALTIVQVFHQALGRFRSIDIYANIVNDNTVPYPSAAIDTIDPFVQWAERGLNVNASESSIVKSWSFPQPLTPIRKRKFAWKVGTLPPILRFRKPYSWLIIALFPILIPLIFLLVVARFSLDTRRSRLRLQRLTRSSVDTPTLPSPGSPTSPHHIPSALGLSIDDLRAAIRAVERNLEQDLMDAADEVRFGEQLEIESDDDEDDKASVLSVDDTPDTMTRPLLTDSQFRMVHWLNQLDLKRHLAWFPDVANSHAVIIVR